VNRPQRFTSLNHGIVYWFNRLWPVLVISISAWIIWINVEEGKPFDWLALFAASGMLVIGHFFGRFIEWLFIVEASSRKGRRDLDQ
jgi:hypothetical protein